MISLLYTYYNNPNMLKRHINTWRSYSSDVWKSLTIVVVDDGSSLPAFPVLDSQFSSSQVQLYRVTEDKPWNQSGARNLAATVASTPWLLVTDIDHLLPPTQALSLVNTKLNPAITYSFQRRLLDGRIIHNHPTTMLIQRSLFWRIGGYDEDFAGYYGYEDILFVHNLHRYSTPRTLPNVLLDCYMNQDEPDAVSRLSRDVSRNLALYNSKLVQAKKAKPKPTRILRFTWQRLI